MDVSKNKEIEPVHYENFFMDNNPADNSCNISILFIEHKAINVGRRWLFHDCVTKLQFIVSHHSDSFGLLHQWIVF
jgi:hypothetical protein